MSKINKNDPFMVLAVRITGAPRTYTILHHILMTEFTPRELAPLERVSKNWNKFINSDTELWWNTWMDLIWQNNQHIGNNKYSFTNTNNNTHHNINGTNNLNTNTTTTTTTPPHSSKFTEKNLKEFVLLQNSLTFTELNSTTNTTNNNTNTNTNTNTNNNITNASTLLNYSDILDDNSSVCSSCTTLTELSSFDSNLIYSSKNSESVCTLRKSPNRKLSRAERKRGPKVWKRLAVEEYRKQEVHNVFKTNTSSTTTAEDTDSDSDDTVVENEQNYSRGKLTSEDKLEARMKYKLGRAKPKTKHTWRNESNISREWMAFNEYYVD